MLFPTFITLLLATVYCSALAIDKAQLDLTKKSNGSPTTNAERLARGIAPAAPQALAQYVHTRDGGSQMRTPGRRQAEASPLPIPPRPNTAGLPLLLTGQDDFSIDITLPFAARIFDVTGSTLRISTNGFVGFPSDSAGTFSDTYYPDAQDAGFTAQVLGFSDDLDTRDQESPETAPARGYGVYGQSDATSVTIRYQTYTNPDPVIGTEDFTIYYTTAQPGVWFVYYGAYTGQGDGGMATVGAQSPTNTLYFSQAVAFRAPDDNLVVSIDTTRFRTTRATA